jgi:hypothetical protein
LTEQSGHEQSTPAKGTEQVHLRLLPADRSLLTQLAIDRDQTLSGAVRFLLRQHFRDPKEFKRR